jgi:dihydrolipoamide dehydrogenase
VSETNFDLIVIGSGPGGYVAAIRAAQLGMKVTCVEKEASLGGTCLNVGCIPSKALLDSSEHFHQAKHTLSRHGVKIGNVELDLPTMMSRKDNVVSTLTRGVAGLFRKNKIEHLSGSAKITGTGTVSISSSAGMTSVAAPRVLIATGSAPIQIPSIPFDGKQIVSSTEALALPKVPGKLLVIGAGVIGMELGSVWMRLGSEVKVIEFLERCAPLMDREMTTALQRQLEKQGMKFQFNTAAQSSKIENGKVKIAWKSGDQTGEDSGDVVLVAVGRKPFTDALGLKELGVAQDAKGYILVNEHYETNVKGIYAIGDVIGGLMLAHKAEEEGTAAVELMAGHAGHVNYNAIPNVIYTDPELASVGKTEEELKSAGVAYNVGRFPFAANGRARAMDSTEGFVKVLADARNDRILGMHILGPRASDMIAECAVAMEFAASSEDIARSVHAHPTLAEAVKEAALGVEKRSIHL